MLKKTTTKAKLVVFKICGYDYYLIHYLYTIEIIIYPRGSRSSEEGTTLSPLPRQLHEVKQSPLISTTSAVGKRFNKSFHPSN